MLMGFVLPCATAQSGADASVTVVRRAEQLRANHKEDAAAKLLTGYLDKHPEDANALTALAKVRIDQGDMDGGRDLLTRALASSPNSEVANLTLGNLLATQHRYPEAMDRFETVLAIDLQNEAARSGELKAATKLALAARSDQHPDVALTVLEHARSAMPDNPQLLLELGVQATEIGKLPEALEALTAARKLSPGNPEIIYALARVELDQQHMADAERDVRAYLKQRPNDASAHFGLGHILAMEQKADAARAEFARSIQLQPVQTESYYQLGQLALNAHDPAEAESEFRKTLVRDAKHGGALTGMGILAFRRKDYAQAEKYLVEAEQSSPDYQPAHYYRGLALEHLGRKQEAASELKKATELDREQNGPPGTSGRSAASQ